MQLRFVTHRHIAPADVETTLQAFRDLWRETPVLASQSRTEVARHA
jgi:hypothetical protein